MQMIIKKWRQIDFELISLLQLLILNFATKIGQRIDEACISFEAEKRNSKHQYVCNYHMFAIANYNNEVTVTTR